MRQATILLAFLATSAAGQTAERPVVKPGDAWDFVHYYSVPSTQANRFWRIRSVTEAGIEATENGEPLVLTPELNVLASPRGAYSSPGELRFPLSIGKKWRYTTDWRFSATGSSGSADVSVEVVAYESILVPAGRFDAFRLVAKSATRGRSPKGSLIDAEVTTTYWYAPAARAVVKSVTHNPYVGVSTVELLGFRSE
jgi:hypothetical protein